MSSRQQDNDAMTSHLRSARQWRWALALLLFVSAADTAVAQGRALSSLQPGDTIRVWAVAPSLNGVRGTLASLRADTLTLGELPPSPTAMVRASVPYASLRRVDVLRGKHRSQGWIFAGTVLGGAAGLFVGAYAGAAIDCHYGCSGDWEGIAGFIEGGAVGLVSGAIT